MLADMGDDVFRFNLVGAYEVGDGGVCTRLVVMEQADAFAFEEPDAETVGMMVGNAAPAAESFKGKHNIGRRIAVHAQQLTHGLSKSFI